MGTGAVYTLRVELIVSISGLGCRSALQYNDKCEATPILDISVHGKIV